MREDESRLILQRVEDVSLLEDLVDSVFADPQARRGMGWTAEDDPEEAMEAIWGLWHRRFQHGWRLFTVVHEDRRAGLAGLGPVEEDGTAWWAVYLLERGQGIGPRVGHQLIERATRDGVRELIAVTWAKNEASRSMLEDLGFEEEGPAPYDWARESPLSWCEYRLELGEKASRA